MRIESLRPKLISLFPGENRLKRPILSLSVIKKIATLVKTSLLRYVFLFWLTFLTIGEYNSAEYGHKPYIIKQPWFNSYINNTQPVLTNFREMVQEENTFLLPSLSRLGEVYKNNFFEREKLGVKSKRLKYISAQGVRKSQVGGAGLQNATESILKYFWFIDFKYRIKNKTPGLPQRLWFVKIVGRQLKKKQKGQLHLFFPKSESKRQVLEKIRLLRNKRYAENFLVTGGQFTARLQFYQTILSRRSRVYLRRRALAKQLAFVRLSKAIKPDKKKTHNAVLLGREKGRVLFQKMEARFKAVTDYLNTSLILKNNKERPPFILGAKKFKT
jgi:hypothetical protein